MSHLDQDTPLTASSHASDDCLEQAAGSVVATDMGLEEGEDDDDVDALLPSPTSAATQPRIAQQHTVQAAEAGIRLDKLCASLWQDVSRGQLQGWIESGELTVNGQKQKAKYRVKPQDRIELSATLTEHSEDLPENIPLDIIYEDDAVLVVNKPVGMVVHPGAGNPTGTLVNALLYHYPNQSHLPRAGLVHRIDKDTSGLLIIGKTKAAQLHLMAQLKDKSVYRHYQCVVAGDAHTLVRHKTIALPIARHKTQRTKMAVSDAGKNAVTHITSIHALSDNYCLLSVALETGRTHQIRVHLSHIGCPLVGDDTYGSRRQLRAGLDEAQRQVVAGFARQALHAYELGFVHPVSLNRIAVTAPLPDDMQTLIAALSEDTPSDVQSFL